MRTIAVVDCSGSMTGGPLDRIIDYLQTRLPSDTMWVAVAAGRLYQGTVDKAKELLRLPGGGSELSHALRYALAPGVRPIVCTDEAEDLRPLIEMAGGRGMDLVVVRFGETDIDIGGLGTVDYV